MLGDKKRDARGESRARQMEALMDNLLSATDGNSLGDFIKENRFSSWRPVIIGRQDCNHVSFQITLFAVEQSARRLFEFLQPDAVESRIQMQPKLQISYKNRKALNVVRKTRYRRDMWIQIGTTKNSVSVYAPFQNCLRVRIAYRWASTLNLT